MHQLDLSRKNIYAPTKGKIQLFDSKIFSKHFTIGQLDFPFSGSVDLF